MRRAFLVGIMSAMLAGCAGMAPSQIGQTAGTIAGSAIAPGIGAPLGALVGLLAGMVVQKHTDQVTERKERRELNDQLSRPGDARAGSEPALSGEPVRVWVDETLTNGRLIAGHFEVRYLP
jgi:hypothetical protein